MNNTSLHFATLHTGALERAGRAAAGFRKRPALVAMLLLVLSFFGSAPARAADLVKGDIISVGIGGVNGKDGFYRAGAWVPVRVRLENRSGKQLVCRLGVEQIDLDGDKVVSIGAPIVLDAADVNGREAWLYYWPRPDDDLHGERSVVVLDESGSSVLATLSTLASLGGGGEARGIGPRDDTNQRSSRFVLVLGPTQAGFPAYFGSYGGTENVIAAQCQTAGDIPDNILGLDGVDTIVWEADQLHPSDLPPDFQLKAVLNWVRGGGHLIVSVAHQGEDFLKNGDRLRDAMPMTFTGLRELKLDDLHTFPGLSELAEAASPLTQITGTLRPDARATPVSTGAPKSPLADHPLAVTGVYGQGAVTVLTVDISNPDIARHISDHQWIIFWNQIAGWNAEHGGARPVLDQILTKEEFDVESKKGADKNPPVYMPASELHVGDDVPRLVDVSETTHLDLLVAVLFLGLYWLAAGPIGHLILRYYKVVHWSWWIFGATVVVAAGVAGAIVLVLQLTNYDVRHKTILLGTVNTKDVTVVGYYGIYAPASGSLPVSLPESSGQSAALNYIAPMCMPTVEAVKPFADPQSYNLSNEHPGAAAPVFRNTLKKMQARWSGTHDGIDGNAAFNPAAGSRNPLTGSLVNHAGYDLDRVEIVVHYPPFGRAQDQGFSYLYKVGAWKNGATLDLATALQLETFPDSKTPFRLEEVLQALGHHYAESGSIATTIGHAAPMAGIAAHDDAPLIKDRTDDLLYLLLDARTPDPLLDPNRVEPIRVFARTTDCTKAFYAAGAMIIAHAGNIPDSHYVPSPIPITVNGRTLAGKGDVLFAWTLPLGGNVAAAPVIPDLTPAPAPAKAAPAAPAPAAPGSPIPPPSLTPTERP